jgi:hypothetical protein
MKDCFTYIENSSQIYFNNMKACVLQGLRTFLKSYQESLVFNEFSTSLDFIEFSTNHTNIIES